jgi:hypothetical protein
MRLLFFAGILWLLTFSAHAQDVPTQQTIEDKLEKVAEEGGDEGTDYSELIENLQFFKDHPINLNHTNKDELKQLGLLDDLQIANLLGHIEQYGNLVTLEELQTIDGFDLAKIREILPFVKIDNNPPPTGTQFMKMLKNGKHQVILRMEQTVQEKKGYSEPEDGASANSRYLGSPLKIYARYRFTYGRYLSWGITGEKDAGEEFFQGTQKNGFDFYSAHLFIRNLGPVKAIALGDYNLSYGQGLTLWSGLAFGKGSDIEAVRRNPVGIAPYSSVNENGYRRGGAVSVGNKNFTLDIFYSNTKLDANILDSSQYDESIQVSSFQTSGYHRTTSELYDKHGLKETMLGGHLSFDSRNLKIGFTVVGDHLESELTRPPSLYNKYDFEGTDFQNTGIDYSYVFRNFNFFGEIARNKNGAMAFVNGLLISLDPKVSLVVLHRNYERAYYTFVSNPFRESDFANERGFYTGITIRPIRSVSISGYYDFFTFPWLRYQVDAPSHGYEYLAQLTYTPSKKTELYLRVKESQKQQNVYADEPMDYLVDVKQINYRFNATYKISATVSLKSRVEWVRYKIENTGPDEGYAIMQDINCNPIGFPVSFNFRYALFDTKTYDSRIYAYENDIPGAFSIPAYYYQGQRCYLMVQWHILRGLDFWFRIGQTVYSNRDVISSGLEEIDGPKKTDLKLQLRYQF